jgi:hypothetical protein
MENDQPRMKPLVFILLLAALLAVGIFMRKVVIYPVLCAVAIGLAYVNYYSRLPIDITPIFFFSVIITFNYGFLLSALFVLVAGVLPRFLAGADMSFDGVFYIFLNLLTNLVLIMIAPADVILYGFIASIFYFLSASFFSGLVNSEVFKEFLVALINIGISFFYFMNVGPILIRLLG